MPKHRTREQKETPNYSFLVSWKPDTQGSVGSSVKGQFKNHAQGQTPESSRHKNANLLDKNDTFVSIKRDLAKSLILASLIIALELVVYLGWK